MNELTKALVKATAEKHPAKAKRNDDSFAWEVEDEYWLHIMAEFGWEVKQRAVNLFHSFRPECFHPNGDLMEYDFELSDIATRTIERMIDHNESLQLEPWGDYPARLGYRDSEKEKKETKKKQIKMF